MSEVETAQPNSFNRVGTNARIGFFACGPSFCGLDIDKADTSPSATWNQESFSTSPDIEVNPNHPSYTHYLGVTFETKLEFCSSHENRKTETAYMYRGAMAIMDVVIEVCDVVRDNFCISFRDGNKIFEEIRDALSQGKHVTISFENVRSLSAAFLESAIGQLYKGEISEEKIKECISWRGLSSTRELLIERAISEAKRSKTE